ncbi:MAG: TipAS antibiotic-recognition domain-containing protein [Gemmatimonadota bacterium]
MTSQPHPELQAEAEARWGDTDAFKESSRRTSSYGPDDWAKIHAELESIESAFARALDDGVPADDADAVALAERARLHIDRWYYPCTPDMHAGIAEMYTTDARFRAHYDDRRDGLAEYVAAAIRANAGS